MQFASGFTPLGTIFLKPTVSGKRIHASTGNSNGSPVFVSQMPLQYQVGALGRGLSGGLVHGHATAHFGVNRFAASCNAGRYFLYMVCTVCTLTNGLFYFCSWLV